MNLEVSYNWQSEEEVKKKKNNEIQPNFNLINNLQFYDNNDKSTKFIRISDNYFKLQLEFCNYILYISNSASINNIIISWIHSKLFTKHASVYLLSLLETYYQCLDYKCQKLNLLMYQMEQKSLIFKYCKCCSKKDNSLNDKDMHFDDAETIAIKFYEKKNLYFKTHLYANRQLMLYLEKNISNIVLDYIFPDYLPIEPYDIDKCVRNQIESDVSLYKLYKFIQQQQIIKFREGLLEGQDGIEYGP